jgi:hypothetical protein
MMRTPVVSYDTLTPAKMALTLNNNKLHQNDGEIIISMLHSFRSCDLYKQCLMSLENRFMKLG